MNLSQSHPIRRAFPIVILALTFAGAAVAQTGRVTVESHKSFNQTVSALKSSVSGGGMMIMATVNQGNMLSMTGLPLKAELFLVGNPTVGKMLFGQSHGVGLYVPLRVFVYQGKNGKTYVSYDRPTSLLKQFHNPMINHTAQMLDQKLHDLVGMVTK